MGGNPGGLTVGSFLNLIPRVLLIACIRRLYGVVCDPLLDYRGKNLWYAMLFSVCHVIFFCFLFCLFFCFLFFIAGSSVGGVGNYIWNGKLMMLALFLMDYSITRNYLIVICARGTFCPVLNDIL